MKYRIISVVAVIMMFFTISGCQWWIKPERAYGEFPFVLRYEKNGIEKIIKDTIVCKYNGNLYNGFGSFLDFNWTVQLASSGDEKIILWEGINKKGEKQKIYYVHEAPGVLMGVYDNNEEDNYYSDITVETYCFDGSIETDLIKEKRLFEKYNIKIISFNWISN